MSTVTNTQVAVKYRQNVGSPLIDMSADNRTTTLGRHIDRHIGRVSVDISTDAWPICWPIYRATHLSRHIDWHSTDMSTDKSVDTQLICQPIRHVGQGVHKIHMIRIICKFWYHGRWFRKFTVGFRPIKKELESWMYNNNNNNHWFCSLNSVECC